MKQELDTLETRIRQVAELCQMLRGENQNLQRRLLALEQSNQQLSSRLEAARTRLTAVLDTLPEDA